MTNTVEPEKIFDGEYAGEAINEPTLSAAQELNRILLPIVAIGFPTICCLGVALNYFLATRYPYP